MKGRDGDTERNRGMYVNVYMMMATRKEMDRGGERRRRKEEGHRTAM